MFNRITRPVLATCLCLTCFTAVAPASVVNYHGDHENNPSFPTALNDDFIIAGTFVPGFIVANYKWTFGDPGGNLWGIPHYSAAVNSGTFRPIGSGTISDINGLFNGTGTATGIDDLPIYLFLFDTSNPDHSFNLALATNPAWRVQAGGNITIDASTATSFTFGSNNNGVIQLQIAPIPEPAIATLGAIGLATLLRRRRAK